MSEVTGAAFNPRRRWRLASLWPMLFLFLAALYLAPDTRSMRNTYYLLVLLPALVLLRREDFHLLWKNPILRAASLLLGYLWLSCLWSENDSLGKVGKTGAQLVYLLVFLLVATRCLGSDVRRKQLMAVLVISAVLGALLSVGHFLEVSEGSALAQRLWIKRMTFWGSSDHPIIGASLYAPAVVCAYIASRDSYGWLRLLWLLGGLLLLLLILRSYSRGPLLAVVGALLVGVILNRDRKTGIVFGLMIVAGLIWLSCQDIGNMLARGTGTRPQIWFEVWHKVMQAPVFGHGLLSEESITLTRANGRSLVIDHPHSIFMATPFYGGLVGLTLLVGLLLSGLSAGIRGKRHGRGEVLLLLLLAMALGVTDNNKLLLSPSSIWLFFWLPFAIAAGLPWPARK